MRLFYLLNIFSGELILQKPIIKSTSVHMDVTNIPTIVIVKNVIAMAEPVLPA